MKRKRTLQSKLNKKELAHMKEWCGNTLRGLKHNRENHLKEIALHPDSPEPCWECRMIARKLGLE